eukprot:COSAG04_NODE_502_length_13354_cov_548.289777_19_plen_59_part_00
MCVVEGCVLRHAFFARAAEQRPSAPPHDAENSKQQILVRVPMSVKMGVESEAWRRFAL